MCDRWLYKIIVHQFFGKQFKMPRRILEFKQGNEAKIQNRNSYAWEGIQVYKEASLGGAISPPRLNVAKPADS